MDLLKYAKNEKVSTRIIFWLLIINIPIILYITNDVLINDLRFIDRHIEYFIKTNIISIILLALPLNLAINNSRKEIFQKTVVYLTVILAIFKSITLTKILILMAYKIHPMFYVIVSSIADPLISPIWLLKIIYGDNAIPFIVLSVARASIITIGHTILIIIIAYIISLIIKNNRLKNEQI